MVSVKKIYKKIFLNKNIDLKYSINDVSYEYIEKYNIYTNVKVEKLKNFHFNVNGKNNKIKINGNSKISGQVQIIINGDNNFIEISGNIDVRRNLTIFMIPAGPNAISNNNSCYIGNNNLFNGNVVLECGEGKRIFIGDNCLFASNITIKTSDNHAIYDFKNKQRINTPQDIVLEGKNWICEGVTILKNTIIPYGSVVGAKSLVTNIRLSNINEYKLRGGGVNSWHTS